jgi:hypothetical protein
VRDRGDSLTDRPSSINTGRQRERERERERERGFDYQFFPQPSPDRVVLVSYKSREKCRKMLIQIRAIKSTIGGQI